MDYSSSQPIFIDANIFLDYALPNIKFGEKIADFLERIEMQDYRGHNSGRAERGFLYSAPAKGNDHSKIQE